MTSTNNSSNKHFRPRIFIQNKLHYLYKSSRIGRRKNKRQPTLFCSNSPPTCATYQHRQGSTTTTTPTTTSPPVLIHTSHQANQNARDTRQADEGLTSKGMWVFSQSMEFSLFIFIFFKPRHTGFSLLPWSFLFFSFFLSLEGLIPKGTWGFSFSIEFFPLFFFSKSPRFYTRRRAAFLPFYGVFPLLFFSFHHPPSP